jgi:predicted  nucleic acid-binding Zn-ribbon protein
MTVKQWRREVFVLEQDLDHAENEVKQAELSVEDKENEVYDIVKELTAARDSLSLAEAEVLDGKAGQE